MLNPTIESIKRNSREYSIEFRKRAKLVKYLSNFIVSLLTVVFPAALTTMTTLSLPTWGSTIVIWIQSGVVVLQTVFDTKTKVKELIQIATDFERLLKQITGVELDSSQKRFIQEQYLGLVLKHGLRENKFARINQPSIVETVGDLEDGL